jgi:hypothetical protein
MLMFFFEKQRIGSARMAIKLIYFLKKYQVFKDVN